MGSVGNLNREMESRTYSGVEQNVSKRINTIISDSGAMQSEQTILIGERNRMTDTLLSTQQKNVLVKEVKDELKKKGLNKKVSVTTPHIGANIYAQYLHIR